MNLGAGVCIHHREGHRLQESSFLAWMEVVMVSLCADQAEGMMFQAEGFCLTAYKLC